MVHWSHLLLVSITQGAMFAIQACVLRMLACFLFMLAASAWVRACYVCMLLFARVQCMPARRVCTMCNGFVDARVFSRDIHGLLAHVHVPVVLVYVHVSVR